VALWKAYTQAGAHLLIGHGRAWPAAWWRVLDDGTYLARMNLAAQKGAHPGGILVTVIEYRVGSGRHGIAPCPVGASPASAEVPTPPVITGRPNGRGPGIPRPRPCGCRLGLAGFTISSRR
jgi:hypothetical protein